MTDEIRRMHFSFARLMPNGEFGNRASTSPRLLVSFAWFDVVGAAAVDPAQEARLVGLDKAVRSGRYIGPQDRLTGEGGPNSRGC